MSTRTKDDPIAQSGPLLPATGFLRIHQIIGNPRGNPPIPAVIPVSRSARWRGIQVGRYPKPVKLSDRVTVWRVEDIRALIKQPV